jgi:ectoine hydroxylase-related dioxygenase (phytanoyl-CoA dioxygenase family)
MEFIAGSHRWGQMVHGSDVVPGSINAGGQTIRDAVDTTGARLAPLRAGQVSLHHTLVLHNSAPNRSADRRIGLGISYIPARVRHSGSRRASVTLVRGSDHGNFELEPDPRPLTEAERVAAHTQAYALYRDGYDEQIARHQRAVA